MMKRYFALLLVLLICLAGCTVKKNETPIDNKEPEIIEGEGEISVENNPEVQPEPEKTPEIIEQEIPKILDVNKNAEYLYEMHIECPEFLAKSKFSSITLTEESAKEFPLLADALNTRSVMITNSLTDEFDNHLAFAYEDAELNGLDDWKTYLSKHDTLIRRADSIVFSTLTDSYTDTPYIEDFRSLMGSTFDSKTGKELLITDVIKDMDALADIVKEKITSHMWTGDFHSEDILKEYFKNTRAEDMYWTLDYNGVTFYFYAGSIAPYEQGIIPVTLGFCEYPEIFYEKYMNVPESYAVRIPVTSSFFADLDNDGELDELVFTANKDELFDYYNDIYIITAKDFYEESYFAYGFNPYYIKTKDDRHLLYLFGEGEEDFNRVMSLYVFEITGGIVRKLCEMPLAPHHSVNVKDEDVFAIPTNPDRMYLDFFTEEPDFRYPVFTELYSVGNNLLPMREGEVEDIPPAPEFDPEAMEEIEFEESDLLGTRWQGYVLVDQQSGMPEYCSANRGDFGFVNMEFFLDGRGIIKYDGSYSDFTWLCDSSTYGELSLGEAGFRYFNIYNDTDKEASPYWIMMQMDENILWMYRIS